MNKPLYLYVGKSASGKTSIAEILESRYSYKTLQSYTTRPKRYEDETGHTFISDEEFDKLQNIVGYTEYNGHRYCATKEQIDAVDIYVIDVPGVKMLLKRYDTDRPIIILYFDTSVRTRIERMINRHDSDNAIVSRLYNDEEHDWYGQLRMIVGGIIEGDVQLHKIDANRPMNEVLYQTMKCMNMNGG